MARAVRLIKCEGEDSDYELQLTDEGIQTMEGIPAGYKITPLAIVGPGRIGKSSLLNKFAGKDVFQTGSSTQRVTEGIWIYADLMHEKREAILYIDVEGFGDPKKARDSDTKLLTVVCQICDVVMYNIKGVYDHEMMEKLIYRKQNQVLSKPILVSVLRDFHLDLPKSPDAELKDLFDDYPGGKCALGVFREIKAVLLVKPVEGKVKDLHKIPDTELQEEFVTARNELDKYLREKAEPLRGNSNINISGKVLAEALRKTVKAVNDEDLRGISRTLPEIFVEQNEKTRKSACTKYIEMMAKEWPTTKAPEAVSDLHEKGIRDAVEEVKQKCFTVDGSVELKLDQLKNELNKQYEKLSKEKSEYAAEDILKNIERQNDSDFYNTIDGYNNYCRDFEQAENKYRGLKNLGPQQGNVWKIRKTSHTKTKRLIQDISSVLEREHKTEQTLKENDTKQKELKEENQRLVTTNNELKKGTTLRNLVTILECGSKDLQFMKNLKDFAVNPKGESSANMAASGVRYFVQVVGRATSLTESKDDNPVTTSAESKDDKPVTTSAESKETEL